MTTNMRSKNTILNPPSKKHLGEQFTRAEVQLANRNSGCLLESLRHDVTPIGQHYLLSHFDVPHVESESDWSLSVCGLVESPLDLSMQQLKDLPQVCREVTLECAGNGRQFSDPRWPSMPWGVEAVSTARWRGTRLCDVLEQTKPDSSVVEWVFSGADRGVDGGQLHFFERSLTAADAMSPDVMLVWEINDQPLPPQHGFPLRLVVPGWYGMASVKWLRRIEAIDHAFEGYQQVSTYQYRKSDQDPGVPISTIKIKSLMAPPGYPDWSTRNRLLEAGPVELTGRAWCGGGVAVHSVEVGIDENWFPALLHPANNQHAWNRWTFTWDAEPGQHLLRCRATDVEGNTQPLQAEWDRGGFGNNSVHQVNVWVETGLA